MLSAVCINTHTHTSIHCRSFLEALSRTGGWGGCWRVWLRWRNGCNAFVCVSLRLESLSWQALISSGSVCFQLVYFFSQARDCMIFTLHSLTNFYVERVTAQRIKNICSFMFSELLAKPQNETKIKTYLGARWPPGVSGALRSLRILHIGRIGSASILG